MMSLEHRVLGGMGKDNALFVTVDSGQAAERLLFDCGESCVTDLSSGEVMSIDHFFFSHLHMDHVAGFDAFFRRLFSRVTRANHIWGPPGTARIMHHRFRGFLWNLHAQMTGSWRVHDVDRQQVRTSRFELHEAFEVLHDEGTRPHDGVILQGTGFAVEAVTLDHRTPVLGYVVREKTRLNIDAEQLARQGLAAGPWLQRLKEPGKSFGHILLGGVARSLDELRRTLLIETPGAVMAYLTDFLLDEPTMAELAQTVHGCGTLVCSVPYCQADCELAARNHHLTAIQAAALAKRAEVDELVLFHLSDRYDRTQWAGILQEARSVFPGARYPRSWDRDR
jgi:ribonuclease Z